MKYSLLVLEIPLLFVVMFALIFGGAFLGEAAFGHPVGTVGGMMFGMFVMLPLWKLYSKLRWGPMPKAE